ncbi:MAG: hypothetical protein Q7S72_00240, partial [Candidatus Taylorbacteria bacterium]|nr:hypothetical protein [Candidatus Taylorbacteria bacterium]
INSLSSYIDQGNLPLATVGSEIVNPKYIAPAPPVIPFTESHKILLNIVLAVLVVLLGLGISWYLHVYVKGQKVL